jgi:large subunit ribosomal protein L19
MINTLLRHIEQQYMQTNIPDFRIGDRVEVHQRILDGPKERIQVFEGDVIARQHDGVRETFTVRRIVQGEGVERIFPLHSPRIAKIVVKKAGKVRRAKLYYLRERVGKATRIREDKERQAKIDEELRRAAEEAAKAAAEAAAKATAEGGTSKSAQKKKAKREAQASGNTSAKAKKK